MMSMCENHQFGPVRGLVSLSSKDVHELMRCPLLDRDFDLGRLPQDLLPVAAWALFPDPAAEALALRALYLDVLEHPGAELLHRGGYLAPLLHLCHHPLPVALRVVF